MICWPGLRYKPWLVSHPNLKHTKLLIAGHERPKPPEAINVGPGLHIARSWATKSWAINLAFGKKPGQQITKGNLDRTGRLRNCVQAMTEVYRINYASLSR